MFEISKRICDLIDSSPDFSDSKLAEFIGVNKSSVSQWRNQRSEPKSKYIMAIADYLQVSVDYLLTGKEPKRVPKLTNKDERDIQKRLEETLSELEAGQDGLMFSGEPLDDETRELLKISLENSIRLAKVTAKEKFTPKKYKK